MGTKEIRKYLSKIGRKGAMKGALARAAALTPERRSEIARKAAAARWKGHRKPAGT